MLLEISHGNHGIKIDSNPQTIEEKKTTNEGKRENVMLSESLTFL